MAALYRICLQHIFASKIEEYGRMMWGRIDVASWSRQQPAGGRARRASEAGKRGGQARRASEAGKRGGRQAKFASDFSDFSHIVTMTSTASHPLLAQATRRMPKMDLIRRRCTVIMAIGVAVSSEEQPTELILDCGTMENQCEG